MYVLIREREEASSQKLEAEVDARTSTRSSDPLTKASVRPLLRKSNRHDYMCLASIRPYFIE